MFFNIHPSQRPLTVDRLPVEGKGACVGGM